MLGFFLKNSPNTSGEDELSSPLPTTLLGSGSLLRSKIADEFIAPADIITILALMVSL